MVKIKKTSSHTCRGCINDGFSSRVCGVTNWKMKTDCGTGKLIFIEEEWDEDGNSTETRTISRKAIRV